jgi:methionyl-tRNA formyltransferase
MAYCLASRRSIPGLPEWPRFSAEIELTLAALYAIKPKAIFIPYWSWKIPPDIISVYECVGFHCTDLPFGRGGSPIENLIARGFEKTKVSVFRMNNKFDAGPIYLKRDLSLAGNIETILSRYDVLIKTIIFEMIENWPIPIPQVGEVTIFKRKTPEERAIIMAGR